MHDTTAIQNVDHDLLASVVGGCGHKRHCGGGCQQQQTVINMPPAAAAAPAAPAPVDPGPLVSTNVSVGYR